MAYATLSLGSKPYSLVENNNQIYNRSESNVQVLQKASTMKIMNFAASSNRANPQNTKKFCMQGFQ